MSLLSGGGCLRLEITDFRPDLQKLRGGRPGMARRPRFWALGVESLYNTPGMGFSGVLALLGAISMSGRYICIYIYLGPAEIRPGSPMYGPIPSHILPQITGWILLLRYIGALMQKPEAPAGTLIEFLLFSNLWFMFLRFSVLFLALPALF